MSTISGSSFSSGTASSGGLGSGIDVTTVVNQLMTAARSPEVIMQQQQSDNSQKISLLQSFNSLLSNLSNSVNSLSDATGAFSAQLATSSNTSVLSASADSTAASGSHTLLVSQLATISTTYADPIAANSTLANGDMKFTVGGVEKTVTIDATNNTVSTLAAYINSKSSDLGVTASVLQNANGTQTLAMVANTSGKAGEISVTTPPAVTTVTPGQNGDPDVTTQNPVTFHVGTEAKDATLTIDGVPLTSGSNTVTNVLPGLTINLAGTSNMPVTLTVSADTAKTTQAIQSFVSNYNTLITSINNQYKVDGSNSQGALAGDTGLRVVQSTLLSQISLQQKANPTMQTLRSLGVNMQNDGTLTVDSTVLTPALKDHFADVKEFFQNATTGFATQLKSKMTDLTSPTQGVFNVDIKGLQDTNTAISKSIDDFEVRMTAMQKKLLDEYNNINAALQMFPMQQSQIADQLSSLKMK
jgi:flagellar hook-associated protein 2